MFTRMAKITVVTVGVLSTMVACSPSSQNAVTLGQDNSAIIGGTRVEKADQINKSTVALVVMTQTPDGRTSESLCTGSLIKEDMVLTAAHCIPSGEGIKGAVAVVFTHDISTADEFKIRYAADFIVHPYYGKSSPLGADEHDVALLRFEGGLPKGYEVAKFLEDTSVLKQGASVVLAGYGTNKTDGKTSENDQTLRKTDVKVVDRFGRFEVIVDQSKGKGACHGDSGGPAFIEVNGIQYVWGVTSRGGGQGGVDDCSFFSVYTDIKAERPFIDAGLEYLEQNKGK